MKIAYLYEPALAVPQDNERITHRGYYSASCVIIAGMSLLKQFSEPVLLFAPVRPSSF
jgi:hypothetical protein